jgi:hypothetical protein
MHRRLSLLLVVLSVGCRDQATAERTPATPSPLPSPSMSADKKSGLNDFDFYSAEDNWAGMSPEQRREMRRRTERKGANANTHRNTEPSIAVAVTSDVLPENVASIVVRDPASPTPRLLVLSRGNLTDRALFLAVGALAWDEQQHPSTTAPREVRIMLDGRAVSLSDGMQQQIQLPEIPTSRQLWFVNRLRVTSDSVQSLDIPGIGRADLIRF